MAGVSGMKTAFAVLAGGLAVAGCSNAPAPAGHPITVDQAYERLKTADLTDFLYHQRCGVPIKAQTGGSPGREVYWQVLSGGEERLRFTIALTPVDAGRTQAVITQIKAREHDGEGYDGNGKYKRPVLDQPIRQAVDEQIAAALEGRAYDKERAGRGRDGVCGIQRSGSTGSARYSVNDRGPDTVRDSMSSRYDSGYSSGPKPGEPDPNAGKPSVRTW